MQNNLKFIQVDVLSKYFFVCKNIYNESFEEDERREYEKTIELQKDNPFFFNVVVDTEKSMAVGIFSYWKLSDFYYVEHLGIDKSIRGGKYGTKIVEAFKEKTTDQIVFEVEPPERSEIDHKRVEWYKRLGFVLNKYEYIQPSYGEGKKSLPLKIMSRFYIPEENYESIKNEIYQKVYFTESIK